MSALDLNRNDAHDHAMALTNGGEAPYVRYCYESDAGQWERDSHGTMTEGVRCAGCRVYVPDGPRLLCGVPPRDGQPRVEIAEAIAAAGPTILALLGEKKSARDKHEEAIGRLRKECRTYRHTIRLLLEENTKLKGEPARAPARVKELEAESALTAEMAQLAELEIERLRVLCVAYGLDPDEVIEFKPGAGQ